MSETEPTKKPLIVPVREKKIYAIDQFRSIEVLTTVSQKTELLPPDANIEEIESQIDQSEVLWVGTYQVPNGNGLSFSFKLPADSLETAIATYDDGAEHAIKEFNEQRERHEQAQVQEQARQQAEREQSATQAIGKD